MSAPDSAETQRPLVALRSAAGAWLIVATVLSSIVGFLDANVINVAVPAIKRDLGGGATELQFVVTGYLLTVASLLLLSGSLSDRFGRRRVLQVGLLVMLLASVLCCVAPTLGWLIAARVVQGAGGALVVPSSLAMLNGTLRMGDRARGIGIWAGLATLGTTVGPFAGGWLVDNASWRWVFLLNIPIIVLALIVLRLVPEVVKKVKTAHADLPGALLAVVGLGGTTYALTAGPSAGWLQPLVVLAGVVGVAALVGLVLVERKSPSPMMRLSLFSSRQFSAINITTVLLYGGMAAAGYLLVLRCELQLGYTAAQAGAVLIPESAVFLLLSPLSGVLVTRIGPRWLMVAGITAVALAFVLLSGASPGQSYVQAILPGALAWGLGAGLLVTPLTASVLAAVRDADLGEASAINDGASRVGALLVTALVPVLIGSTGGMELALAVDRGYSSAMIVMAVLAAASAVVTGIFVSNARGAALQMTPGPRVNSCAIPLVDRPVGTKQP
ncbi:MFS transporter [Lacisediminihabitans changchengi]|uniref:MFS transporter n=1 Tax=Lacisediminihabitans changchengi TaxID=2787634 RepID=A0A934SK96_9MICO|nr:MFS transporter [Lacisediminihabitans changchengi]MBK4347128.1 MFS transporter [Lacisediminihabitans changchengi]